MQFLKGRSNLAVTVFVPYDCTNNCKFCTSKAMYHSCKINKDATLSILKFMNLLDIPEVVLTGGEPFADLEYLQTLIDVVEDKDIYINTTLPTSNTVSEKQILEFISKNKSKISGINISRHCSTFAEDCSIFNKNILSDESIAKIPVKVKINCVINDKLDFPTLFDRWNKLGNIILSLRGDYRNITLANLKTLNDDVIENISHYANYVSHGGCDVCFDVSFKYAFGPLMISYHRGLEHSSIKMGKDIIFVNDIIIKPDGNIYYDWDDKNEDIAMLFKDFAKISKKQTIQKPINKTTPTPSVSSNGGGYNSSVSNQSKPTVTVSSCGGHSNCGVIQSKPTVTLSSCGGHSRCGW